MCGLTPRPWKMPQPSCSQAHPRTRDLSWSHSQLHKTDPTGTRGDPSERTAGNLSSGLRSSPPGQVTVPFPRRDHTSWRKTKVLRAPSRKQSVEDTPPRVSVPVTNPALGGWHTRADVALRLFSALLMESHDAGREQGAHSSSLHHLSPTSQERATIAPTNISSEKIMVLKASILSHCKEQLGRRRSGSCSRGFLNAYLLPAQEDLMRRARTAVLGTSCPKTQPCIYELLLSTQAEKLSG